MVISSTIILPGQYFTCEDHEENWLRYDDVYQSDGTRKKYEKK